MKRFAPTMLAVRRPALLRYTFLALAAGACADGSPAGPRETPTADSPSVPSVVELARIASMLEDPFIIGLLETLNEPAAAARLLPAIRTLSERLRAMEPEFITDALADSRAAADEYAQHLGISDDDYFVLAVLDYVLGRADELLAETTVQDRTPTAR